MLGRLGHNSLENIIQQVLKPHLLIAIFSRKLQHLQGGDLKSFPRKCFCSGLEMINFLK